MNIDMLVPVSYTVLSVLIVYIAVRPSNRKRVLQFALNMIQRGA